MAECSESTGIISHAVLLGLGHDQLPGADQGFLVGKADSLPRPDGGQGGLKPQHAHHGGNHRVGLGQRRRGGQKPRLSMLNLDLRQVGKPRPKLGSQLGVDTTASAGWNLRHCCSIKSKLLPQVRAATESPRCSTTERVWRPMEPVEPKMDTVFVISSPHDQRKQ